MATPNVARVIEVDEHLSETQTQKASISEAHSETFSKFRRVLEEGEEESFKDLGLGRGVDATNPTPWLNKKALQIREVISGDIIGTEEGNLYQGFVNEVESTQHFQTNLSASVPVNQLVNLGIDSELSRSYSATQKSVGRKIITRTISFLASFDRIVEKKPNGAKNTFEDRLLEWIEQQREEEKKIKSFKDKEKKRKKDRPRFLESGQEVKEKPTTSQIHSKSLVVQRTGEGSQEYVDKEDKNEESIQETQNKEEPDDLYKLCYKFVSTFSVTHYVHTLELGASHYRVMSLEEYSTKFSSKAKLGVGQLADIAIGNEKSFNAKKYKSQTTKVGRMKVIDDDDDHRKSSIDTSGDNETPGAKSEGPTPAEEVHRGSIGEAVVGVKLQPISSLVSDVELRLELQKALQKYIRDRQKVKFGPFYIACNWDQVYLKINRSKNFEVEATYNIDEAAEFMIIRCDEGDNHFYIVHEPSMTFKRDKDKEKFVAKVGEVKHKPAISMYLCASVNWRGKSKGNQPLRMRLDGKSTNSRLAIHSRKNQQFHPADLTEWVNEKEIFFINCQERSVTALNSSYLCVYESGETGCEPRIESHDDKRKFMLFRLIKPNEQVKQAVSETATKVIKGPFLIKNVRFREELFFRVNDTNEIEITKKQNEATNFFIRRVNEYSNYFEVIISRENPQLHLSAMVNWRGYRSRPLQLRSDANAWSYLAIYDKSSRQNEMKIEDPSKIEDENEAFYISCYVKPAFSTRASYLIINAKTDWRGHSTGDYSIGCVPSIKHNQEPGEPMLFKLVKQPQRGVEQRHSPQPSEQGNDSDTSEEDDNRSVHIAVETEISATENF